MEFQPAVLPINRKLPALLIFVLLFIEGSELKSQPFCDFIQKVQTYQDSVKLIQNYKDECKCPQVDTATFNISKYMSLFDKLTLQPGKVCFLFNNYDRYSGMPLIYVRDESFDENKYVAERLARNNHQIDLIISQKTEEYKKNGFQVDRINRMKVFWENQKKCLTRERALSGIALDSVNKACNNLIPEDTKEGYLQYLFFNQMGDQFALCWHSYYIEKSVICSKKDIEFYLSYYKKTTDSFTIEEEKLRDLLQPDLSPHIELNPDECLITWYEIRTHEGIYKTTFSIERTFPFRIKDLAQEKLVAIAPQFFY
jgi:hypothetical protein